MAPKKKPKISSNVVEYAPMSGDVDVIVSYSTTPGCGPGVTIADTENPPVENLWVFVLGGTAFRAKSPPGVLGPVQAIVGDKTYEGLHMITPWNAQQKAVPIAIGVDNSSG